LQEDDFVMTEKVYRVRDNGLRCFVPPCFSWDVVEVASGSLTTASDIDLTPLHLDDEERAKTMQLLTDGRLHVQGYLSRYQTAATGAIPASEGAAFVITQIVGREPFGPHP
jgi:hypothetical protein